MATLLTALLVSAVASVYKATLFFFIGKNTLAKVPMRVAKALGLPNPESYTGHTFRRTSATALAEEGASPHQLQAHGRWASVNVANRYVELSGRSANEAAQLLTRGQYGVPPSAPPVIQQMPMMPVPQMPMMPVLQMPMMSPYFPPQFY